MRQLYVRTCVLACVHYVRTYARTQMYCHGPLPDLWTTTHAAVVCPVLAATRRLCQSSAPCWPLHAACASRLPRVGRFTPPAAVVCPVWAATRHLQQSSAPCWPLHAACASRLPGVGRYTPPAAVVCPVLAATCCLCQSSSPCGPLHAACSSRLPRVGRYTLPVPVVCPVWAATRRLQQSSASCRPLHAACSSRLPRVAREVVAKLRSARVVSDWRGRCEWAVLAVYPIWATVLVYIGSSRRRTHHPMPSKSCTRLPTRAVEVRPFKRLNWLLCKPTQWENYLSIACASPSWVAQGGRGRGGETTAVRCYLDAILTSYNR